MTIDRTRSARRGLALGLVCACAACVRGGFERVLDNVLAADDGAADRGAADRSASDRGAETADQGARADGAGPDPRCAPAWRCRFTLEPPQRVSEVDLDAHASDPVLSADCRTIRFGAERPGGVGGNDVWEASRPDRAARFGTATNLTHFNSEDIEHRVVLSGDGLEAYVTSQRPGGPGGSDIWVASRAAAGLPFAPLSLLGALNTPLSEWDLLLSSDGLRLYFARSTSGGGLSELMVASRPAARSAFSAAAVPIVELNTSGNEDSPALSADELFIVFGSNRAGSLGAGDLWYARRASRSDPFGPPQRLPVVNSAGREGEAFLACGDEELWFVSDREEPETWKIYRSRFLPAP